MPSVNSVGSRTNNQGDGKRTRMKDIEGKVAFITGGASGMGLGMAKVFSESGKQL